MRQKFASGEEAPPTEYTYHWSSAHLNGVQPRAVSKLDAILAQYGSSLILADRSTPLDLGEDGRPDLEVASNYTLLKQEDTGFSAEPLAANPTAHPACRKPEFSLNQPRVLVRLDGTDSGPQVVNLQAQVLSLIHI